MGSGAPPTCLCRSNSVRQLLRKMLADATCGATRGAGVGAARQVESRGRYGSPQSRRVPLKNRGIMSPQPAASSTVSRGWMRTPTVREIVNLQLLKTRLDGPSRLPVLPAARFRLCDEQSLGALSVFAAVVAAVLVRETLLFGF